MAEASISVDQDQFSCPVCLDLLKDPVTTPCGHSYCMVCINGCWDQEGQKGVYRCPQCRETFTPRPVLRRNNMLAEVVEKLKRTDLQAASPAHCYAGPGDVECDFCTGRKLKAIKSCLMCVASYCEVHLEPHYQSPAFKKHKLVKAFKQLQETICSRHDKLIEIYCRTDQSCICYLCTMEEHKGHDTVSAATERTEKESHLKRVQRKVQQRLQEKEKNLQEVKQTVKTLKSSAQTAVEDSERIFTELIRSIEKKCSEVTELIRSQEKAELSRAEELLEKLEQEIADLKRRDTELEQLPHTEDHIQFLQSFQSLCVSAGCEDSSSITVQHLSFDGVRKSLSDLKERLEEFCKQEFSKISPHAAAVKMTLASEPKTKSAHKKPLCVKPEFAESYTTPLRMNPETEKPEIRFKMPKFNLSNRESENPKIETPEFGPLSKKQELDTQMFLMPKFKLPLPKIEKIEKPKIVASAHKKPLCVKPEFAESYTTPLRMNPETEKPEIQFRMPKFDLSKRESENPKIETPQFGPLSKKQELDTQMFLMPKFKLPLPKIEKTEKPKIVASAHKKPLCVKPEFAESYTTPLRMNPETEKPEIQFRMPKFNLSKRESENPKIETPEFRSLSKK